jgi:hypothetical protein
MCFVFYLLPQPRAAAVAKNYWNLILDPAEAGFLHFGVVTLCLIG